MTDNTYKKTFKPQILTKMPKSCKIIGFYKHKIRRNYEFTYFQIIDFVSMKHE